MSFGRLARACESPDGNPNNVTINGAGLIFRSDYGEYGIEYLGFATLCLLMQLTTTFTPTVSASAGGNHSVSVSVNGQASGTQNFFDQVPTASRIVQTTTNSALATGHAPCASGKAGWIRVVNKIVTDQSASSNDIVAPNQSLTEQVTVGSPNDFNITSITTGTATTNSVGQFQDTFFLCSSLCPQSTGTSVANQTITDAPPNGGSFALSSNSTSFKCTEIIINGQ